MRSPDRIREEIALEKLQLRRASADLLRKVAREIPDPEWLDTQPAHALFGLILAGCAALIWLESLDRSAPGVRKTPGSCDTPTTPPPFRFHGTLPAPMQPASLAENPSDNSSSGIIGISFI